MAIRTTELLKFEWSDPYALEGVPILGYNVLLQITTTKDGSSIVPYNGTVYERELAVTNEFNDGFCVFVNFTIAAINMVGVGSVTSSTEYFAEGEYSLMTREFYLHNT